MAAPQSTPLPPAPQRNEPESVFIQKSNTFVAALEPHRVQLQAQADFVDTKSALAVTSAANALISEELAQAAGNFIGEWASLTGAVLKGVSVAHSGKYWGSLVDIADITLSEPGVSADWQMISRGYGTAAEYDTGTAQNQIELNSQKTFKSFDSLTSAIAFVTANPSTIERVSAASRYNEAECLALSIPYPVGGGDFYLSSDTTSADNGETVIVTTSGQRIKRLNGEIANNFTVTVPTNYATLQLAIDDLVKFNYRLGAVGTIEIESGHAITEGFYINGVDCSALEITSADIEVLLSANVALQTTSDKGLSPADTAGSDGILFLVVNSITPLIKTVFNLNDRVGSQGMSSGIASTLRFLSGSGIKNAAGSNVISFSGSHLQAHECEFTGSAGANVWVSARSSASIQGSNLDDGGTYGLLCTRSSNVNCTSITARNAGLRGIRSSSCSAVMASLANVSGSEAGIQARTGASIDFTSGVATGITSFAIDANSGGTVAADNSTCSTTTGSCVVAFDGGKIDFASAAASSPLDNRDIFVSNGGEINARGATGEFSQAANVVTGSGIIYDSEEPDFPRVITNSNGTSVRYADGSMIMTATIAPDWASTLDQSFAFPDTYAVAAKPAVYLSAALSTSAGFRTQIKDALLMYSETGWVLAFGTAGLTSGFQIQVTAITRWK